MDESPSTGLSHSLRSAGFKLGRLQTGTPARLDKNTIDFSGLERQDGDAMPAPFSYLHQSVPNAVSYPQMENVEDVALTISHRAIR
jgi:tRNA uridine 5-carboxymethylaminomethyl modification enzyme